MSECRQIIGRLTGYVDEALPAAERAQVEAHLSGCPSCNDVATAEQAGRTVLRGCADRLRSQAMPPGLMARCEAVASEHCAPRLAGWRTSFLPVAVATLLIVFTGAALFSFATRRSDALLAAQLTADHMDCFRALPAAAVEADAATVERMLQAEYGWDVHVPPSLGAEGLRLVGARRCLYIDGRIPHVMYRAHGEDVSLFILAGVARADANVVTLGHRARIWSRGANTYVLVSSRDDQSLAGVAGYVRQEAQ